MTIALYASFLDNEAFCCHATPEEVQQAVPRFINEYHQEPLADWPRIFWTDADCWIVVAETLAEAKSVLLLRYLTTEVKFSQLAAEEFPDYVSDAIALYNKIQVKPIKEWAAYFTVNR